MAWPTLVFRYLRPTYLRPIACVGAICFWGTTIAESQPGPGDVPCTPWPAIDALGREVPTFAEAGSPRAGRYVGMFYFLWHDRLGKSPYGDGPYDVSKIMARDPDALSKPDSPLWGPNGMYHYWSEPLYGYYLSTDQWVLRRHAQLLADAGIDTLILDATNALTYRKAYLQLCEVYRQVRRDGGRCDRRRHR